MATAVLYGTGRGIGNLPTGEILLLGLGSTGAVALHAATQWWGARRAGVVLLPLPGWRDAEVRAVVRRALPALGQAGLDAVQLLALLIAAEPPARRDRRLPDFLELLHPGQQPRYRAGGAIAGPPAVADARER